MRRPWTQLYLHLVWSTWDRLPLLSLHLVPHVYGTFHAKCAEFGCELLSVGGTSNHVHLLIRWSTTVSIADLVKGLKGTSSHLVNQEINREEVFKWQGGYGAFTISKGHVAGVRRYIENQEAHHREGTTEADLEREHE